MEEVDSIIIRQLNEIGCDLVSDDEPVTSLKELDSNQVLIAVGKCISVIKNDDNFMSKCQLSMNQSMNMSNKYKAATQLATSCQELGFKGDIGYQTFLYGNENDIRKLLLFLIERFPKDELPVSTSMTSLRDTIETRLARSSISLIWIPPFDSHNEEYQLKESKHIPEGIARSLLMNKVAPNRRKYYDAMKLPHDFGSLIEWNCREINKDSGTQLIVKNKNVKIELIESQAIAGVDANAGVNQEGGSVSVPKPARRTKMSKTDSQSETAVNHENKQLSKEEQKAILISQLEDELTSYQNEIVKLNSHNYDLAKFENELKMEQDKLIELKASQKSHKQLKDELKNVKSDIEKLSNQWQDIECELNKQLERLKLESQEKLNRSTAQRRELIELKKSINSKLKEIKVKEEMINELMTKMPQQFPPGRSSYTKRIFEIVNNIKKQNDEIKKVLLETRTLQKDINILSGKLSRTFAVADELIFKEARNNEWNRKCYKLLASMHDHCDQLLSGVGNIGTILREIRQLEEAVETERSRKTTSNLTRILADLNQIKLENDQLTKKIPQINN